MSYYKVAVFGAGFVGIPTASVLALNNPGIEVIDHLFSLLSLTSIKRGFKNVERDSLLFMNLA